MSIAFRFGFILIALLALHVFFIVFRQLGEVSLVFNEIVHHGIMAYRIGNDGVGEKQKVSDGAYKADYVAGNEKNINDHRDRTPHDPRTSSLFKTDHDNPSEFKQASNARYTRGQFRRHFHAKIFTVQREIFQSLHKSITPPRDRRYLTATRGLLPRERPATSARRNKTSAQASAFLAREEEEEEEKDTLPTREYPENLPASRGARVMILAYQRSGSSFIGEMFNRNPDVFYLFEPIQPIEIATGQGKFPLLYDTLVAHLLHVVYTCSFDKHPYLVNFLSSSPFRLKSQTLTSSGLCDADVTAKRMHLCRPVNASILKRLCSSRSNIVIKTIRASSRKLLEFVRTTSDPREKKILSSLKVLHLVRDPRAIIASRLTKNMKNLSSIWPAANSARLAENTRAIARSVRVASSNLCSRIHSDMKYGGKLLPARRYAMIRYEDAAMRPLKAYEEIYEFAGMDRVREVEKWLTENTGSDSDPGYYSTSRNSSASARGWRTKLPFALVREIQKQCGELMETLGYIPVQDETDLRDLSNDLVMPLSSWVLLRKSAIKDMQSANHVLETHST